MIIDVKIENARLVIPKVGITKAGIAIKNGKIVAIAHDSHLPDAEKKIDAEDNYILPGIIEPHSHLGNYAPFINDLKTETASAAGGGVTTLFTYLKLLKLPEPYCKYESHLDKFDELKKIVENNIMINVAFHLMMTVTKDVDDIGRNFDVGINSFKYIMGFTGEESKRLGIASLPDDDLYRGFENIAKHKDKNGTVCIHTENVDINNFFRNKLVKNGRNDLSAWTESRPEFNEVDSLYKVIYFSEQTKCPLYIVHVDNGVSLKIISEAKQKGINMFAETCPHYLAFTKNDDFGILGKISPPLRNEQNIRYLWDGITNGTIDTIGTDHMGGMLKKDKIGKGDVWSALSGFPGVETMLPFMLSEGVNKKRITLEHLAELCSYNASRIFGLYPEKGTISVGSDADLTIVNLHKKVKVAPEVLHSASDFTLFEGWTFEGWPVLTMVRGNVVMENGTITGKCGEGRYVKR